MIAEHAVLQVRSGQSAAFQAALREAVPLIAASPGFHGVEVRQSTEHPERYLLRVLWSDVASHRDGFRKSERYERWRKPLHRFYEPMPNVEYFGESIV